MVDEEEDDPFQKCVDEDLIRRRGHFGLNTAKLTITMSFIFYLIPKSLSFYINVLKFPS